jgi:outer membrane protein assembly factor BamB
MNLENLLMSHLFLHPMLHIDFIPVQARTVLTAPPASYHGNIYINCHRGIFCLSGETGNLLWMKELVDASYFSLTLD